MTTGKELHSSKGLRARLPPMDELKLTLSKFKESYKAIMTDKSKKHHSDNPYHLKANIRHLEEDIAALEASDKDGVEADILTRIETAFHARHDINGEAKDPKLWALIARVGIEEIDTDIRSDNKAHMVKEFADLAFVAMDGLRKMGYDFRQVMSDRLDEIAKKDMTDRDMEYYRKKLESLASLKSIGAGTK